MHLHPPRHCPVRQAAVCLTPEMEDKAWANHHLKYMTVHCPALLKLLQPPAHLFDYSAVGEIKTEVFDMRPASG